AAVFRGGVLGLVHAHTRGHMYGAAILALAGLGLAVVIAHAALRRGEAWAWWSLAGFWLLGAAAVVYEVFGIYPHGFPLAPTPADGVRGFGWPTLAAWIVIWAAGLAVAAPAVLAGTRQPQQVTARVGAPGRYVAVIPGCADRFGWPHLRAQALDDVPATAQPEQHPLTASSRNTALAGDSSVIVPCWDARSPRPRHLTAPRDQGCRPRVPRGALPRATRPKSHPGMAIVSHRNPGQTRTAEPTRL